jgi:hypothetical protein
MLRKFISILFCFVSSFAMYAQKANRITSEQCGTMQRLENKFKQNPLLKTRFEIERGRFNSLMTERNAEVIERATTVQTIPVVFHIVLNNPGIITDAQIQAQLDTLNKNFLGLNDDSVKIPAYFKSLFGKSTIEFCLARRTPDGEITNGIQRIKTSKPFFGNDDGIKHTSTGGVDSWDTDKYFNVWITVLSDNLLGYASFPEDGSPEEQGVVIDYRALPNGSYTSYNKGKTLVHETGHYFNLYHIWGDDGGACTGTDYVDDTPNQENSTSSCYSGIHTDRCTASGNGIMYQNFMDYTPDGCMMMFTKEQVNRMETALHSYRSSLLTSNGCSAPVFLNYDVQLTAINLPGQHLCEVPFNSVVSVKNKGLETITSLKFEVAIDGAVVLNYDWSGSITHGDATMITLPSLSGKEGLHIISILISINGEMDEDTSNNSLSKNFQYYAPVSTISESFEEINFSQTGWDVVNPDSSITWQKTSSSGKNSHGSIMINNYDYTRIGEKDDLRLPAINISSTVDSAFLSFNLAAAGYTSTTIPNNNWDTLEILLSKDCGSTYTSLYKKWGSKLITRTGPTTVPFVPTSGEWRKDSINLGNYIGENNLLIAFRNTTGNENNLYLDDIKLRTVTVNPNLKKEGFLVSPNPAKNNLAIQFYPQPINLKGIQLYNAAGQKISEIITENNAGSYYNFNLTGFANGVYIVKAIFSDKVLTKKVIKN